MPSRLLSDLRVDVRKLAGQFLQRCKQQGIDVLVTCTWRSIAEQDRLYAQGRTAPGKIVTNACGGQSKHNHTEDGRAASLAFDVVPLRDGKPVWGTAGEDGALWRQIGAIGEAVGLEWAGNWKRFREFPHFQIRQ